MAFVAGVLGLNVAHGYCLPLAFLKIHSFPYYTLYDLV